MADQRDYEDYPALGYTRKQVRGGDGVFRFELDTINGEVCAYLSCTTTAATLGYTVPTGKVFHLRTVSVVGAKKSTVRLRDQSATGTKKFGGRVASGTGLQVTGIIGPTFTTAVYVEYSSANTGGSITIGGFLDPQADI